MNHISTPLQQSHNSEFFYYLPKYVLRITTEKNEIMNGIEHFLGNHKNANT